MKNILRYGAPLVALAMSCGNGSSSPDGAVDGPTPFDASVDTTPCEYPQETPPGAGNDPRCPATYGGAQGGLCTPPNQPCDVPGLGCRYYGVGDGRPGCYAIAVMQCNGPDAGTFAGWICAN